MLNLSAIGCNNRPDVQFLILGFFFQEEMGLCDNTWIVLVSLSLFFPFFRKRKASHEGGWSMISFWSPKSSAQKLLGFITKTLEQYNYICAPVILPRPAWSCLGWAWRLKLEHDTLWLDPLAVSQSSHFALLGHLDRSSSQDPSSIWLEVVLTDFFLNAEFAIWQSVVYKYISFLYVYMSQYVLHVTISCYMVPINVYGTAISLISTYKLNEKINTVHKFC